MTKRTLTKVMTATLATGLLLSACGKKMNALTSDASCSSEATQEALQSGIKDAFEKYIKGQASIDISKARATFAQLKIIVDHVRTTKEDPNSTKKFCAGTVKLSVPTDLLNGLENTVELAKSKVTFKQSAKAFGLESDANVFSKDVEYNVQPSDDGKSLFTELEHGKSIAEFIGLMATIDQKKGEVESQMANAASPVTMPSDTAKQPIPNAVNTEPVPATGATVAPKSTGGHSATVYDPPSNVRVSPDGNLLCTLTQRTKITVYDYAGSTYDGSREVKWYNTDACGSMGVIAYSQFR